jgi:hypothetical protein
MAPLALFGVALIALPIAVHLLVRHQVRTLAYPSLRFLKETQLAAFRRRRIEDLALLICRCAVVALAAIALAGPVLQTPARSAEQSARISRAIVVIGSVQAEVTSKLSEGAFRTTTVARNEIGDALRDAARWLDAQPRSAREIVVAGVLRRGAIASADLAAIPPEVGIRFEQTASELPAEMPVTVLAWRNDRLVRIDQNITLNADSTRVVGGAVSPVASDLISIIASARDTALAEAAMRAALVAGVPWRDVSKRIVLVWDEADDAIVRARSSGAEVVRMRIPVPAAGAADAVRAELVRVSGVSWVEPALISRAQLDSWSRVPGSPSPSPPVADEGDRRWLWALALVLLTVEWWLRRHLSRAAESRPAQEARVA